jgi:hypothetical protein
MAIFFLLILVFSGKMVWGLRSGLGVLLILTTLINGNTTWKLVFFNAVIAYGILLMTDFFKSIKINSKKTTIYLRYLFLPLITFLFSSIFKLGDFKPETIELGSNFILDEIPSNQIATYMGLGFFLIILFVKMKVNLGITVWQEIILGLGLFLVGVISFSRGGIIVGLIGMVFLYFSNLKEVLKFRFINQFIILGAILAVLTIYLNKRTNGNLFLRYQGETKGTLVGSKEKNINTLTTNRYNIMMGDIYTFVNNPLLGVETGRSLEYREDTQNQKTHVEFSRLLAEHGLIGLLVTFIWFGDLFKISGGLLKSLYVVGFLTTLHGATRTVLPLVLMLISMVKITESKTATKT